MRRAIVWDNKMVERIKSFLGASSSDKKKLEIEDYGHILRSGQYDVMSTVA